MNTIRQLSQYALQELKDSYSGREILSLCNIIYMDVLHFTNIDIHIRKNEILHESFTNKFIEIIRFLKLNYPIQYILEETEFAGLHFSLTPAVLIPRPETAELVIWVREHLRDNDRVLDIGTGSGCIAVSLARSHPKAFTSGVDISAKAIEVARTNAENNQASVDFFQRDILNFENYTWDKFRLIVSNPPYIRECEKQDMAPRVLGHEPHQALFVPDSDPLLFYRRIAEFGQIYLEPDGHLFFEINEALGKETVRLLQQKGYRNIELKKDIYGKDRMIKGQKR